MIHRLTGGPQAVALDRLGKDYRRLTFGVNGVVIGVVNLVAIMTTARKMQDLVVAHVFDQLQQLRVLAKEMFAGKRRRWLCSSAFRRRALRPCAFAAGRCGLFPTACPTRYPTVL